MNTTFSVTSNPSLISTSFYSAQVPAALLQTTTAFTQDVSSADKFNTRDFGSTGIFASPYRGVTDYTDNLFQARSPFDPPTGLRAGRANDLENSSPMVIPVRASIQLMDGGLLAVGSGDGISYLAIGDKKDDGIEGGTLPPILPWERGKSDGTITPPLSKRPEPIDTGDSAALIKILDHKDGTKGGANLAARYIIFNALMVNSTTSALVRAITVLRTLNEYMIGPVTTLEGFKEMITKCVGYEQWFDEHGGTVFRMLFSGQLVGFACALRDAGRAKDAEALFGLIADIDTPFPSTEKDGSPIIAKSGERIRSMTVLVHGSGLLWDSAGRSLGRGRLDEERRDYFFGPERRTTQVQNGTDEPYWTYWDETAEEMYAEEEGSMNDTFSGGPAAMPLEPDLPNEHGNRQVEARNIGEARAAYQAAKQIAIHSLGFKTLERLQIKLGLLDCYELISLVSSQDPALTDTKRLLLSNISSTILMVDTDTLGAIESANRLYTAARQFLDAVEEEK